MKKALAILITIILMLSLTALADSKSDLAYQIVNSLKIADIGDVSYDEPSDTLVIISTLEDYSYTDIKALGETRSQAIFDATYEQYTDIMPEIYDAVNALYINSGYEPSTIVLIGNLSDGVPLYVSINGADLTWAFSGFVGERNDQ